MAGSHDGFPTYCTGESAEALLRVTIGDVARLDDRLAALARRPA